MDITFYKLEKMFWLQNKKIGSDTNTEIGPWFRLHTSTMYIQIFNHNISLQKQHGKPSNVDSRHVGDLGNIVTPPSRFTLVNVFDGLISLDAEAENGIANRAIVVHAGEDDLGMNYLWHGCWGGCAGRGGVTGYGSLGSGHRYNNWYELIQNSNLIFRLGRRRWKS